MSIETVMTSFDNKQLNFSILMRVNLNIPDDLGMVNHD